MFWCVGDVIKVDDDADDGTTDVVGLIDDTDPLEARLSLNERDPSNEKRFSFIQWCWPYQSTLGISAIKHFTVTTIGMDCLLVLILGRFLIT